MNAKDKLYDAIKEFSDGDEDVYHSLKKEIYELTHCDSNVKRMNKISLILFFTDHNKNILSAINEYIQQESCGTINV